MQQIIIEVKDTYTDNVFEILHSLKGIMIDKIKFDEEKKLEFDFMKLQVDSMKDTWDNQEYEVWDEL